MPRSKEEKSRADELQRFRLIRALPQRLQHSEYRLQRLQHLPMPGSEISGYLSSIDESENEQLNPGEGCSGCTLPSAKEASPSSIRNILISLRPAFEWIMGSTNDSTAESFLFKFPPTVDLWEPKLLASVDFFYILDCPDSQSTGMIGLTLTTGGRRPLT